MKRILLTLSIVALLCGCASLYSGVVTITSVVDSAMKSWASLSNKGLTNPEIDAKVTNAHNQYRKACAIAQEALIAYKASGDQSEYLKAFEVVKAAAGSLIDMIVPLVSPSKGTQLKTDLAKAKVI